MQCALFTGLYGRSTQPIEYTMSSRSPASESGGIIGSYQQEASLLLELASWPPGVSVLAVGLGPEQVFRWKASVSKR